MKPDGTKQQAPGGFSSRTQSHLPSKFSADHAPPQPRALVAHSLPTTQPRCFSTHSGNHVTLVEKTCILPLSSVPAGGLSVSLGRVDSRTRHTVSLPNLDQLHQGKFNRRLSRDPSPTPNPDPEYIPALRQQSLGGCPFMVCWGCRATERGD